jgi:hypothetical protein
VGQRKGPSGANAPPVHGLVKLDLVKNGIKTVYDLQSYWMSMAAILPNSLFTFSLALDI